MITFDEGRAIVAANNSNYPPEAHFTVEPWGFESDEVYVVVAGPFANLRGPAAYAAESGVSEMEAMDYFYVDSGPSMLVVKETGEYREVFGYDGEDPAPDLVPIGDRPE